MLGPQPPSVGNPVMEHKSSLARLLVTAASEVAAAQQKPQRPNARLNQATKVAQHKKLKEQLEAHSKIHTNPRFRDVPKRESVASA